jgi:hypothetical protein
MAGSRCYPCSRLTWARTQLAAHSQRRQMRRSFAAWQLPWLCATLTWRQLPTTNQNDAFATTLDVVHAPPRRGSTSTGS